MFWGGFGDIIGREPWFAGNLLSVTAPSGNLVDLCTLICYIGCREGHQDERVIISVTRAAFLFSVMIL